MESNDQLYEFVVELVGDLRRLDKNESAQKIDDALSISTLPGEILGQLRIELNELVRRSEVPDGPIKSRLFEAIDFLNRVLS